MKKVLFIMLLVMLMSVAVFAGGKSEETAQAEEEPVEILVWAISQDSWRPFLEKVFSNFNDAHEDIQIVPEYKDTKAFDQLLITSIAAKEGPDIFFCLAGPVQSGLARNGSLLALNDYFPKKQMEAALRTDFCEVDGKNYAMPAGVFQDLIQYNKEIFREAGLNPDKFPETWDELMDACEKIKKIGVSPFGFTNKEGWYLIYLVEGFTVQNFDSSVEVAESVFGPKGTFTDPRFLEGLKYVKELYDKGYLLEGGMAEPYELLPAQMISGQVAMTRGHERFYNAVKKELGDITGLAVFPKWSDKELAGKIRSGVNCAWYAMEYTEHPEETVEVIAGLTGRESGNLFYETFSAPPATTDWDMSLIKDPNLLAMQNKASKEGVAVYYIDIMPSGAVLEAFKKNLPLYVMGEITAQEWGERVDAARE